MAKITILGMTLQNFKCHKLLRLDFGGEDAAIYGDNATGKSSISDALHWLLLGKDAAGNGDKNIEVKPLNSQGEVADHAAITAVEATLMVDDARVTLRRELREIWAARRGAADPVFVGNETAYFWDGVPVKKAAYDTHVHDIAPESVLTALLGVRYFARDTKWQDRRAVLCSIANLPDDRTLMQESGRFDALIDDMGTLTLDEYKAKLLADKKSLTVARDDKPARIDEAKQQLDKILDDNDFDDAENAAAAAEEEIKAAREQMQRVDDAAAKEYAQQMDDYMAKHAQLLDKCNAAKQSAEDAVAARIGNLVEREAQLRAKVAEHDAVADRIDKLTKERQRIRGDVRAAADDVEAATHAVDRCRAEWLEINAERFSGGICAACGQQLPTDKIEAAKQKFEGAKKEKLAKCVDAANTHKETIARASDRVKGAATRLEEIELDLQQLQTQLAMVAGYRDELSKIEQAKHAATKLTCEETESIADAEDALNNLQKPKVQQADHGDCEARIAEAQETLLNANAALAAKDIADGLEARIATLTDELHAASAAVAHVEQMLWMIGEFGRYKAEMLDVLVNDHFELANFRLSRVQANGGIEERCDVTFDGVPYSALNNAAQVNVGIDIIRTLSRHYGVVAPLIVDNAESVTQMESAGGQMIRLVVSAQDKKIRLCKEAKK